MKHLTVIFFIVILLTSCNKPDHHLSGAALVAHMDSLKSDLLKADIAFSKLSEEKGRNASFIEFADSSATMLRTFGMPIAGKDSIAAHLNAHPDSMYKLTWIPVRADVARSGDLGYTYGIYTLEVKNRNKEGGTYCTVWRKNRNHQWKFVLDTGNEGLSPEDNK